MTWFTAVQMEDSQTRRSAGHGGKNRLGGTNGHHERKMSKTNICFVVSVEALWSEETHLHDRRLRFSAALQYAGGSHSTNNHQPQGQLISASQSMLSSWPCVIINRLTLT